MAGVAGLAVVDIAAPAAVRGIHGALGVFVAGEAGERLEVGGVGVTGRARRPPTGVRAGIDREVRCIVVEPGAAPGGRRVAILTRRRELCALVGGVGGAVVRALMAR